MAGGAYLASKSQREVFEGQLVLLVIPDLFEMRNDEGIQQVQQCSAKKIEEILPLSAKRASQV